MRLPLFFVVSAVVALAGCATTDPSIDTDPATDSEPSERWAAVATHMDAAFATNDRDLPGLTLSVWNRDDDLVYTHTVGDFDADRNVAVASASKLVSVLVLLRQVELGRLALDETTGDRLGWTGTKGTISLDHMGAFTTGFDGGHLCTFNRAITLQTCADRIRGSDQRASGTWFDYGPTHLQIAGAMAEVSAGSTWNELFDEALQAPLGQTDVAVHYRTTPKSDRGESNPLVAGGLRTSMNAYAPYLSLILHEGKLDGATHIAPSLIDRMFRNNYPAAQIGSSPAEAFDYRYGFGAWLYCAGPVATCDVIGSPGLWGFSPWVDRERGYYAILATESPKNDGSTFSFPLAEELRPLIEAALEE